MKCFFFAQIIVAPFLDHEKFDYEYNGAKNMAKYGGETCSKTTSLWYDLGPGGPTAEFKNLFHTNFLHYPSLLRSLCLYCHRAFLLLTNLRPFIHAPFLLCRIASPRILSTKGSTPMTVSCVLPLGLNAAVSYIHMMQSNQIAMYSWVVPGNASVSHVQWQ